MKRTTVLMLLGIVILGLTAAAMAETATRVRANVPFAFYAGKELIPAGEYVFEIRSFGFGPLASSVLLHDQEGSVANIYLTKPGEVPADEAHLHFNKYGNSYFLSRVEGAGYQANLTVTRAEKEMRVQAGSPASTTVAASR